MRVPAAPRIGDRSGRGSENVMVSDAQHGDSQVRDAQAPLVLVVEDYPDAREMYAEYLRFSGFRVAEARNGEEALTRARQDVPDIVLMDLALPLMDGWEATRRLKADDATRDIPVIALTAHAMAGDREKAMEAGCDDYDTKPVEMERLLGKIAALLATKAA